MFKGSLPITMLNKIPDLHTSLFMLHSILYIIPSAVAYIFTLFKMTVSNILSDPPC